MSTASTWPDDKLARCCEEIRRDGFTCLPAVFSPEEARSAALGLESALRANSDPAIRGDEGSVQAARNILAVWPEAAAIWRRRPLLEVLAGVLGPGFGLVRVLYFDKPPGQSWALPWHKDLVVAVRDNTLPSTLFRRPTRKAGVPHVEAPVSVLETMLTARIHLDAVTRENGPLKVAPGSHLAGKGMALDGASVRTLFAGAGDVLLIRPLVAHCSNRSTPGTAQHRRILHLEFSGCERLPDGFAWHDYYTAQEGSQEENHALHG
jgi:hypothetical protein